MLGRGGELGGGGGRDERRWGGREGSYSTEENLHGGFAHVRILENTEKNRGTICRRRVSLCYSIASRIRIARSATNSSCFVSIGYIGTVSCLAAPHQPMDAVPYRLEPQCWSITHPSRTALNWDECINSIREGVK